MKKVKMNNSKVLNIVKETLERDGVFVSNSKIDSVIKKYLSEREEMLLDDESHLEDSYSFSKESKQIFSNTVNTLKDTVEDLNIIQVKEGDVLINTDVYSEEYLESIMNDLEDVIERLEFIKGLE
jgi:hypothetical protein